MNVIATRIRTLFNRHPPSPPAPKPMLPEWIEVSSGPLRGREIYLDTQLPAWREMAEGGYEAFIFDALGGEGYEGRTVWDVGAFMGYHALAFAALVGPAGRVVTFEPNPFNAERVRSNLARSPDLEARVTVVADALSNRDGQAAFIFSRDVDEGYSSGSHMAGALAPEDPSVYSSFDRVMVSTVRADTLLAQGRVPPPSLVKLDVEGAEGMVLEGAVETLTTVRPTLLIEVHHAVAMFQVQRLLSELGYELEIVNLDERSASRCHVLAKPRRG